MRWFTRPGTVRPGCPSRSTRLRRPYGKNQPAGPGPATQISHAEIDRIVAGTHHDPHSVLGAHQGPAGTVVARAAPAGGLGRCRAARRPPVPHGARAPGRVRGHAAGQRRPRLPAGRRLSGAGGGRDQDPARDRHRRPVPAPADARRDRPAPDRRGQARAAVAGARRPRQRAGRRHRVRRLGAERARRPGDRRLQPLGRARAPDALAGRVGRLGAVRAGGGPGHAVQVRHLRPGRRAGTARPTRWPRWPSGRPPPPRWSTTPATSGATRPGWPSGRAATRWASR